MKDLLKISNICCLALVLFIVFSSSGDDGRQLDKIGDYNPHVIAFAYDTVQFQSTQNVWYMLTNPTNNAFTASEIVGFHLKQDTLISDCNRAVIINGYFRVSGPQGVANREYDYRIRINRDGVDSTIFMFGVSSSGLPVMRSIPSAFHTKKGDKIWGEIRTTSTTGELNFYGGMVVVHCID